MSKVSVIGAGHVANALVLPRAVRGLDLSVEEQAQLEGSAGVPEAAYRSLRS